MVSINVSILSLVAIIMLLSCHFIVVDCVGFSEEKSSQLVMAGISNTEPRKKQQQQDVFSRILPMLATPFIMQATILPLVLIGMKFMLMNSLFIGKLALILWVINLLRSRNDDRAALYSHNINLKHNDYPGHFYEEKHHRYSPHYEARSSRRRRR